MINFTKSLNPILLLLLVFLLHLFNNFIVVNLNNAPFVYDALDYYHNATSLFYSLDIGVFRPPLLSFLSLPLFQYFGVSQKVAALGVGAFSLFVLLFTTYLLGKAIYSKGAGLLSAVILSCFPVVFGHSRSFMSDLLLGGWVTFFVLLLIQPQALVSLEFVIPLGVISGLGMLTRVSYPLYIAGPLIYLLQKKGNFNKKIFLNLLLIFFIGFLICAFWYLPNFYNVLRHYIEIGQFLPNKHIEFITLAVFGEYGREILVKGMSLICLPLILALFFKKNKIRLNYLNLFFIWIIVPYIILSIFNYKNIRFIIPILPAIAIVFSALVLKIEKAIYKTIIIIAVLLTGIAQVLLISYSSLGRRIYGSASSLPEYNYMCFGLINSWKENWPVKEICNSITQTNPQKVIFIKTRPVIINGIQELIWSGYCKFDISLSDFDLCCMNKARDELRKKDVLLSRLLQADTVVRVQNSDIWYCNSEDNLESVFLNNINNFVLINTFLLPDNSKLNIYKKK